MKRFISINYCFKSKHGNFVNFSFKNDSDDVIYESLKILPYFDEAVNLTKLSESGTFWGR